ncbi:response regulator receiver domain-containing protein [Breoghania corrubedonensis]|uniref:Response regulator receiver domain-containing protein n=1 Tax=Breoghania corrubedonensis TaxID=665038 RepID=A0A2T5VH38_9HYPH|nr:response regulator [Breoghania corrubedonensis]PTW63065.1 response regulator receiver domain-containing protein [Breoghania corrubedonensis]
MNVDHRLRILIADDSTVLRMKLREYLGEVAPNAELVEADNGNTALKAIVDNPIDIVFLDINMPELSGLHALHLLKKKGDSLFVVLMSTQADQTLIKAGNELGSYDFLKKPFTVDRIRTILRAYVHLSDRKKVLIVDDSATVRKIIYRVLANCRFDMLISEVDSGKEALTLLKGTQPDIIFLDYHMPDLNGVEAAHYIRAESPAVKIVMVSSKDMSGQHDACLSAGIFCLVKKPFFPKEVDFILHRLYGLNMPQSLELTPNVTLL